MPTPGQPIRYAIYTRQSVDKPTDFSSCEAQFLKCRDAAANATAEKLEWIGTRFDDEGVSGGSLQRPAMNRLRKVVAAGGIDRVYVVALDRLSRRAFDLVALLEEFDRAKVGLCLASQLPPPRTTAEIRFIRHMLGVFAEFERDMTASRIAETRAYLKHHGRRIAGPAPYGYRGDPATKQLVPIPKEARRVRLMFERAVRGQKPSEIAARINHLKWRTKTWTANRSAQVRGGGKWTARQVLLLLRNPVYVGRFREGKRSRPGCHAAIVDTRLFDQVQAALDGRRTVNNDRRNRIGFPLRGKIICPKCRRPLGTQIGSRVISTRTRIHHRYYCCRSHSGGRPPCKGVHYPAHEIERFVRDLVASPHIWRQMDGGHADDARPTAIAALWRSLGPSLQDQLLPKLIDRVTLRRRNTEIEVTFNRRYAKLINAAFLRAK